MFKKVAESAQKTFGISAIILTHGETDSSNPDYQAGIWQFYQDYNADLKAASGQTSDIVMLASQESSSAPGYNSSAVQLWRDSLEHPNQIIVAGPKYQYGPYGLHMSAGSYLRLGEKYGEVFDLVVNQKKLWKPVGPNKVTRAGAIVTIDFDVPNPLLAWDERLVAPHQAMHTAWAKGRGFEVSDKDGKELAIDSVEIQGTSVVLTLSQSPDAGAQLTLGYAVTEDATDAYEGGTDAGPHGQLRDSDETVGSDFEMIEVSATNGSPELISSPGGFVRRAPRDVVTGAGLPHDTVAIEQAWDGIKMSTPWSGATGKVMLQFNHDLHNYCVHFAMAIP